MGAERRQKLLEQLREASRPLSGAHLAAAFGVSRQIIVQDIALLRAEGHRIESTNRGYVLREEVASCIRLIKVRHTRDEIEAEFNAVVDNGGRVIDVMVNHRTYGLVRADMDIRNRRDVKRFLRELELGISEPLMNITNGYHFHRIGADSEEALDEVERALEDLGFIAPFTDYEKSTLPYSQSSSR